MNPKIWKWLNRIFASGIWLQPFVMTGLVIFAREVFHSDVSAGLLFFCSFIPSVYVWSENQRQKSAGKTDFGIEDTFHNKPTEYSSPLKLQAMYPQVNPDFLYEVPEGVVLGKTDKETWRRTARYLCKPLSEKHYKDGHVLILGGSGSGKSSAIIIPTLLSTERTGLFCVDIKGELHRKSRKIDAENVVIVDFQDRGKYGWDALAVLNAKKNIRDQDIRECMEEIANSLIPISAKDSAEFWKQASRSLLIGELTGLYKQRNIHNLSELINEILSYDTKELVKELMDGAIPKAVEVKLLSSFRNLADETLSGVVQQQEEALKVFIDDDIRYAFETNKKQAFPQMIEEGKEIFLSVKEEKLEAYYNVVNLIISQVFGSLIKRPEGSRPVLVVIDELARLCARGQIPYLHNGILLTGRSRNITLMLVTQSYEALQNAYTKQDVESMVANCAYLVCLDVRSQETAKSICSMAGNYKERETTWSGNGKNRSLSISYRDRPILEPSDLAKLVQMDEAIIISSEFFYNRIKKASYFKDPVLNARSVTVQRYNNEVLELEGKEPFLLFPEQEKHPSLEEKWIRAFLQIKKYGSHWKSELKNYFKIQLQKICESEGKKHGKSQDKRNKNTHGKSARR